MKKLLLLIFVFYSCSSKEEKFELFSPEAYAFSIGDAWELNASCRVKGFVQRKEDERFSAKLSFTTDLLTPGGKLLQNVDEGLIDQSSPEKINDLEISTQLILESVYQPGKYKIIFNVTDDFSKKSIKIEKEFELSK